MTISKKSLALGATLALAAATITVVPTTAGAAAHTAKNVHCFGVNTCKGHNDCKTATNACKGMASCKGKGFVAVSASACGNMGGKVK